MGVLHKMILTVSLLCEGNINRMYRLEQMGNTNATIVGKKILYFFPYIAHLYNMQLKLVILGTQLHKH